MTDVGTKGLSGSIAAFFIAVLSGLGVGSGGLLVIWLTMVEGMDAISARGLNLLFFIFSASAALIFHVLRKRLRYRLVIFMAAFACIGTVAGSYVGSYISASALRVVFGYMLIASGIYTVIGKMGGKRRSGQASSQKNGRDATSIAHK